MVDLIAEVFGLEAAPLLTFCIRFKICRWKQRAGSIPASGTSKHKRFSASGY